MQVLIKLKSRKHDTRDRANYENDTDASPALKLETADDREMTGKVFEDTIKKPNRDSDTSQIMTGEQRYREQ